MSDLPVPSTPRGGAARNARGSVGAECDEAATEAAAGIACIESQNALLASIEARLAIDLDQAPSNLSVQLSDDPSRHLSVDSLERYPVFVALDAGNLAHVVPLLRKLYPHTRILILADDDWRTRDPVSGELTNPGRHAARAVARKVAGCDLVWPIFKAATRGEKDTDFNDLQQREGLDAVRKQLSGVVTMMARRYG